MPPPANKVVVAARGDFAAELNKPQEAAAPAATAEAPAAAVGFGSGQWPRRRWAAVSWSRRAGKAEGSEV